MGQWVQGQRSRMPGTSRGNTRPAGLVWLSALSIITCTERSPASFWFRAHAQAVGLVPSGGRRLCRRQSINVSLSLPSPLSLKSINTHLREKKKQIRGCPYEWDRGCAWPGYHHGGQLQFAVHINGIYFVVKVSFQYFYLVRNVKINK